MSAEKKVPRNKATAKVGNSSNRGSKPGERRGGRKKGTPNKIPADVRAAILGGLEANGGQAYLEKVAEEQPQVFCTLLGKVLPTTLAGDTDAPLMVPVINITHS